MTLNEYQIAAGNTDHVTPEMARRGYYFSGLTGEAGEVADNYKKMLRDDEGQYTQDRVTAISKELGDVLWYVARLAFQLGFTLEDIALINLAKLASREDRGQIHGSGDNR